MALYSISSHFVILARIPGVSEDGFRLDLAGHLSLSIRFAGRLMLAPLGLAQTWQILLVLLVFFRCFFLEQCSIFKAFISVCCPLVGHPSWANLTAQNRDHLSPPACSAGHPGKSYPASRRQRLHMPSKNIVFACCDVLCKNIWCLCKALFLCQTTFRVKHGLEANIVFV